MNFSAWPSIGNQWVTSLRQVMSHCNKMVLPKSLEPKARDISSNFVHVAVKHSFYHQLCLHKAPNPRLNWSSARIGIKKALTVPRIAAKRRRYLVRCQGQYCVYLQQRLNRCRCRQTCLGDHKRHESRRNLRTYHRKKRIVLRPESNVLCSIR